MPEHDAEKCERFSDDIMLSLFNLEQDSEFRPTRPKIILFSGHSRWRPHSLASNGNGDNWTLSNPILIKAVEKLAILI
ncbi:hypothetical protein GFM14_33145 [Rhizobium leguminosarum bv. viciae]|jgi:hypothetical protein|nr:hypothetical protein [Rhizobium leguminosarum bv. viciae]NNU53575.1 hypothetical protein [Rhizobium indigoferae]QIO60059.1 hypothetical protein HA463_21120 [Rhizobium leguminosarum bv. trifolii]GLR56143.1 hypothetical protein GCM10007919_08660 [Rhizobium indigoferae]